MKPQDLALIAVLAFLLFLRRKRAFVLTGLLCIAIALPLYARWIFFTAQRLVMYGALFIALSVLIPERVAAHTLKPLRKKGKK